MGHNTVLFISNYSLWFAHSRTVLPAGLTFRYSVPKNKNINLRKIKQFRFVPFKILKLFNFYCKLIKFNSELLDMCIKRFFNVMLFLLILKLSRESFSTFFAKIILYLFTAICNFWDWNISSFFYTRYDGIP